MCPGSFRMLCDCETNDVFPPPLYTCLQEFWLARVHCYGHYLSTLRGREDGGGEENNSERAEGSEGNGSSWVVSHSQESQSPEMFAFTVS